MMGIHFKSLGAGAPIPSVRRLYGLVFALALTLPAVGAPEARAAEQDQAAHGGFVGRSGSSLILDGKPFRFGGANIDWLALNSNSYYRPDVFYPSPAEVDDALDTVVAMGGTVVRSHTLGINVGCPQCVEAAKGVFNEAAMRRVDFALKRIADHRLRVIIPLVDVVGSDCHPKPDGTFPGAFYYGNTCPYLAWNGETDRMAFHTSPAAIREFKAYVSHLLNRVNTYTGVAYKDDPAILGWETCNSCALVGKQADLARWVADISAYIKGIDRHHLVIDGSGLLRFSPHGTYTIPKDVDVICSQYYPYWDKIFAAVKKTDIDSSPASLVKDADTAAAQGRPYLACEYGWDQANWKTPAQLDGFLQTAERDPKVSGALFWDLEGHAADHGWMPVHGPVKPGLRVAEQDLVPGGDWWAFYYTGRDTRWNAAADMYGRGQSLRAFAYAMSGRPLPSLPPPPAPRITGAAEGLVQWRGSVGAASYSVERAPSAVGPWSVTCDHCAIDDAGQWQDPDLAGSPVWYRVVPFNPDGKRGTASAPVARLMPDPPVHACRDLRDVLGRRTGHRRAGRA